MSESVDSAYSVPVKGLQVYAKSEPSGTFEVNETVGALRVAARRYERMPQWCTYRGTTTVFTMADCLIVKPQKN